MGRPRYLLHTRVSFIGCLGASWWGFRDGASDLARKLWHPCHLVLPKCPLHRHLCPPSEPVWVSSQEFLLCPPTAGPFLLLNTRRESFLLVFFGVFCCLNSDVAWPFP